MHRFRGAVALIICLALVATGCGAGKKNAEKGAPNVTDVIKFNTTGIKSYWMANFLTASDGNQYCIVTTTTNAGAKQLSSISFTDITNGHTFGGSWPFAGDDGGAPNLTPSTRLIPPP